MVNSLVKRNDQPWVFIRPQWSLLFSLGENHVYPTCKSLLSKHITSRSSICWRRWKAIYGKGSLDDFIFAWDCINGYILHTRYYSNLSAILTLIWFKESKSFSMFQRAQVWTPENTQSVTLTSQESQFVQIAKSWRAASGQQWAPPSCPGQTSRIQWTKRPPWSSSTRSSTISQTWFYFLAIRPGY